MRRIASISLISYVFSSQASPLQHIGGASLLQKEAVLFSNTQHRSEDDDGRRAGPGEIKPLDLWAIHDLLLVGHKGPLVMPSAQASHEMVALASEKLGYLLPFIHPVAACRDAIAQAVSLDAKAQASLSCLGLGIENFTDAYTSDAQPNSEVDHTSPNFNEQLGACRSSQWPRACSYWSSAHALSVRADIFRKGPELLEAFIGIIAGGALYCTGCTDGFRLLNKNILPFGAFEEEIMGY